MRLRPTRLNGMLALLLSLSAGACQMPQFLSQTPQVRGNKLDPDALKQLTPGTSTRADVIAALGSPTTKATFDDNQWLYISMVTRPVIGGTQSVLQQRVWVMTFSQAGVLTNIRERTLADSEPVEVVSRTTPSPGSDATFLQELLGNVGKFSPEGPTSPGDNTGGGKF